MKSGNKSIIFLAFLIFSGCHQGSEKAESRLAAVSVIVTPAAKVNSAKEISLSGNVEGNKTVRLGFLVAGRIDHIAAEEGNNVTKDKLIASIEPTSYAVAKELADIQVNQVQDEYDRLKSMYDKKSLSESDFAKITYGLQQAKAQQKLHAKNLADTRLYSPINGILLKRLAEPGEITGTGIPVLVVSDISKIKISAYIPENELQNVKIGQKAVVNVSSVSRSFDGRITEVGSLADPSSRSFLIRIEVDNPGLLMRPGMIAGVTIPCSVTDAKLAIPAAAVAHDFSDKSYVFIADTLKHRAFKRYVTTGLLINDMIEILSGLEDGEPVITGGYQKLTDGTEINISQ
jgi:RND family efflux transporter MFP subunit